MRAPVVAALMLAAALAACGDEDERASPGSPPHVDVQDGAWTDGPTEATTDHLPCTTADEPANFAVYWLGPRFKGLELSAVLRRCDKPYPGEPLRANSVSLIYGTCEIPPEQTEGGCAPPLEIQSSPACESAAAGINPGGLRSGDAVIDVHGGPELRTAAADALRETPADTAPAEIATAPAGEPNAELPPPTASRSGCG